MKLPKLIILGILKEGPKHGYEIKKNLQKELGIFSAVETSSIYYPLQKMEREGLIKTESTGARSRLARRVYAITDRGEKEFLSLALEMLESRKRPFLDIDIPLYFLSYLETRPVIARLRLRKRFLENVRNWLLAKLDGSRDFSVYQNLLLKHHLDLLGAEEKFVDEIIKVVKGRAGSGGRSDE